MTQGPIFVVGSMRSGSTLLRLILDSHPDIAIPPETGFMGAVAATKAIPNWQFGDQWFGRLGWSEDELDVRIREFYAPMFERYAAQQGKRRWGEKTPFHTSHIPAMAAIFPDAVFVGVVRHAGGVATSLRKTFHYTLGDALSYWAATNLEMVRSATALGDRFVLCRYEELVRETEPVLRELLEWLDEDWSDSVLMHHAVQKERRTPRAAEGATSTRDPVDPARADRWRSALSLADQSAIDAYADQLGFFGYDSRTSELACIASQGDRGSRWLASGGDLRQRRGQWADRLDFEPPPPPVMPGASEHDLVARLQRAESALARTRSRTSVRVADGLRKVQHGRSWRDLRDAIRLIRGER